MSKIQHTTFENGSKGRPGIHRLLLQSSSRVYKLKQWLLRLTQVVSSERFRVTLAYFRKITHKLVDDNRYRAVIDSLRYKPLM